MDYLLALINSAVGNQELARLLFVGAIGLCVVLVAVTVALLLMGLQDPVQRRLSLIKHGHASVGAAYAAPSNLQLLLEQVGQRFSGEEPRRDSPTRQLLMHAGYRSASAVQVYWAIRLLLPALLLVAALLALPLIPELSLNLGVMLVAVAVG